MPRCACRERNFCATWRQCLCKVCLNASNKKGFNLLKPLATPDSWLEPGRGQVLC